MSLAHSHEKRTDDERGGHDSTHGERRAGWGIKRARYVGAQCAGRTRRSGVGVTHSVGQGETERNYTQERGKEGRKAYCTDRSSRL